MVCRNPRRASTLIQCFQAAMTKRLDHEPECMVSSDSSQHSDRYSGGFRPDRQLSGIAPCRIGRLGPRPTAFEAKGCRGSWMRTSTRLAGMSFGVQISPMKRIHNDWEARRDGEILKVGQKSIVISDTLAETVSCLRGIVACSLQRHHGHWSGRVGDASRLCGKEQLPCGGSGPRGAYGRQAGAVVAQGTGARGVIPHQPSDQSSVAVLAIYWASLGVPFASRSWKGKTPRELRHKCSRLGSWVLLSVSHRRGPPRRRAGDRAPFFARL